MSLVKSRDSENGKVLSYKVDFNKGLFVFIPESDEDFNAVQYPDDEHRTRYDSEDSGEAVF